MKTNQRTGLTMIEVVVAAGVLMTTMSVVVSLSFRAANVQRQTRQQRLALDELSNQLDRITQQSAEQAKETCGSLELRSIVAQSLPGGSIAGEVVDDSLGPRVVLKFQWEERMKMPSMTLVGWLKSDEIKPEARP